MKVLEMLNYVRAEQKWINDFINAFNETELIYDRFCSEVYNELDIDLLVEKYENAGAYLDLDWNAGATKVVLCLKNFAFKSPYTYMVNYYTEEDYNELSDSEKKECDRDEEGWFSKIPFFMGSTGNYCDVEAKVYQKALSYGVADFFAETVRIPGTHVYVQERYLMAFDEYNGRDDAPLSKTEINDIRKTCCFYNSIPDRVISWWANHYSYSDLLKLGTFLKLYDINDLHAGNIAFFPDGKLKIIDYSGYCSSTSNLV